LWKRGGGTDRTCLAILHNGEVAYASNAGKLNELAPEAYIQPQENLFINWNLKNPVNQQNKTNYTESGYCIDMWIGGLASDATTGYSLNVTPDGLVLLPLHYVSQYFEQVTWEGELVTFALLMDGILYTVSWKWNKDAEYELIANFKGLLIRYSGKYKYIQLLSTAASNLILQAAKAEKGSIFTGWPVWNYALELARCQRYQIEIFDKKITGQSYLAQVKANGSTLAYGAIPIPVSMRDGVLPVIKTDCSADNPYLAFGVCSSGYNSRIEITEISVYSKMNNGVVLRAKGSDFIQGNDYQIYVNNTSAHHFLLNCNL